MGAGPRSTIRAGDGAFATDVIIARERLSALRIPILFHEAHNARHIGLSERIGDADVAL